MNEITKRQTALEILGIDQKSLSEIKAPAVIANIEARKGLPIRSLLDTEMRPFLVRQMELVMANLGQNNSSKGIIEAIMESLPSELKRSYFNWTREEISEAWKLGSLGRLEGDEVHLSARNLFKWLNKYDEQHRKPAYRKLKRLRALKSVDDTQLPKIEEMTANDKREALNEAFKDKELIKKAPKHYYNLLSSLGLCKIADKSETWELIGKANAELLIEIKVLKSISREEAINRKNQIKGIVQSDPTTVPEFVKNRAKQIKILSYFESLPENHKF